MTVTDLHKAEVAFGFLITNDRQAAQAVRLQHAAMHYAQGSGPGPGHAFQESPAIDAVVVVIVQDFILYFRRIAHSLLLASPLAYDTLNCPEAQSWRWLVRRRKQ